MSAKCQKQTLADHEAQFFIESWRRYRNGIQPYASLGYRPAPLEVSMAALAELPGTSWLQRCQFQDPSSPILGFRRGADRFLAGSRLEERFDDADMSFEGVPYRLERA